MNLWRLPTVDVHCGRVFTDLKGVERGETLPVSRYETNDHYRERGHG
jgi:hypothetical protein